MAELTVSEVFSGVGPGDYVVKVCLTDANHADILVATKAITIPAVTGTEPTVTIA
jgi:hypothetical protein